MKKILVCLIFITLWMVPGGCVKDCTCIEITHITNQTDTANTIESDTATVTENTRGDCKSLNDSTRHSLNNDTIIITTTITCEPAL